MEGAQSDAPAVPHRPGLAVGIGVLIGLSCCALVFNYNVPGSLETALEDDYNFTSGEISLVLFFYSVPNTALSLFAGEMIDRIGLTAVAAGCVVVIQGASVLFALSLHLSESHAARYHIMIAARLALGFGDSLGLTCMPAFVARWFRHNHNGLAMGVGLMCVQVVGSAMSFFMLPFVRKKASVSWALWTAAFVAAGSAVFFVIYVAAERKFAGYLRLIQQLDQAESDQAASGPAPDKTGDDPVSSLQQGRADSVAGSAVSRNSRTSSLRGRAFLPEIQKHLSDDALLPPAGVAPQRSMCDKLRSFSAAFWLQNLAIFFTPVAQYISINYMHYFLEDKYDMSETSAGICASVVYFCCVLAPAWGALCDRFGGRLWLQLCLALVAAGAFVLLRLTHISPWALLGVLGVCFAGLEQNCYAVIDHLMPADLVGFGYGVMGFVYNIGLGVLPLLADFTHTRTGAYNAQNFLFAGWLLAGMVCTVSVIAAVDPADAAASGLLLRGTAAPDEDAVSGSVRADSVARPQDPPRGPSGGRCSEP